MDQLERRGVKVFRFHPAELLRGFSATCHNQNGGSLEIDFSTPGGYKVSLVGTESVYFRNTDHVRPPREIGDHGATRFAAAESDQNFRDLLECLPGFWLTRPSVIRRCQSKPLQARVAGKVGLRTPRTCWSNDPEEVQRFLEQVPGDVVLKPISDVEYYLGERPHVVWASRVTKKYVAEHRKDIPLMFGIYQEHVPRARNLRVTVVGDEIFGSEIVVPEAYANVTDWREVPVPLKYKGHDLPAETAGRLLRFNQELGVCFGAMDLLLTDQGEYFFLESNINGQWLWIEQETGMPISEAIAGLLIDGGSVVKGA